MSTRTPLQDELEVKLISGEAGESVVLPRLLEKTLQISGTFVATLKVRMRASSAADWIVVATLTAPGAVDLWESLPEIQIYTDSYTSGTPRAFLTGIEA